MLYACTFILCSSHPGYFGKVGMRHYHLSKNKYWCPTVNLDKIWSLVSEQTRLNYKEKKDVAPVIDCVRAVSGVTGMWSRQPASLGLQRSSSLPYNLFLYFWQIWLREKFVPVMRRPACVRMWRFTFRIITGLLQSARQGNVAQAASYRQSQVLQPIGRSED